MNAPLLSTRAIPLYDELSGAIERHQQKGLRLGETLNAVELLNGVAAAHFQCAVDRAAEDTVNDADGDEWKRGGGA